MRPLTWVTIEEVASGDWALPARPRTRATSSHALRRRAGPAPAEGQEDLLEALGQLGQSSQELSLDRPVGDDTARCLSDLVAAPAPRRNQKTSWPSLR